METHLEKKFYVPKISEFHVGFEFEFNGMDANWNQYGFKKQKVLLTKDDYFGLFTLGWVEKIYYKPDDPLENWIRVKYLDKEDIEELGWGYSGDAKANDNSLEIIYFSIDDYSLSFYLINDMYGDNINISISQTVNGDYDDLFQGTIRNKSELKRIMKIVGI